MHGHDGHNTPNKTENAFDFTAQGYENKALGLLISPVYERI